MNGLADYTRQSSALLGFLSQKHHPCLIDAEPVPNEKFPVVLFSHGLGGCMEMYTLLCQEIASHGYIVIAVEHGDGSGAYAENNKGEPIYYKRPDDSPYSRSKVVNFRRDFLEHRVEELETVLSAIGSYSEPPSAQAGSSTNLDVHESTGSVLSKALRAVDTTKGLHLLGHSFGGATMVKFQQDSKSGRTFDSLSVLDCWAFSLSQDSLGKGVHGVPFLSILSESWVTNPETEQVKELLMSSSDAASFYIPNSLHISFSDAASWLPSLIAKRMRFRAPGEERFATIRSSSTACIHHMQNKKVVDVNLEPFPIECSTITSTS